MNGRALLAMELAVAALVVPVVLPARPRLVWNASPSVPTGLYWISPPTRLVPGQRLVVRMSPPWARLMAQRGYLPAGVPLLKPLAAATGTRVCRIGQTITIAGHVVAEARARDRVGRALPVWSGCFRLAPDQLFLLAPARADSVDSRYFGAVSRRAVLGVAHPVWTDERGSGRRVWFAASPPSLSLSPMRRTQP
ncbi:MULTISPECIES: S26 family signal peptidase [unclassified Novosphingobium]|uniref:S26 family signal peptidase n=1 Tax=unclassified Novosphingobium TaxID=2644732 RepID=UPI00146EA526|nr:MULTISPECIES: S26 family signal peptidase [unclassified Novosphingobium]NMN06465.1 conjugative transfer signal peptidase TraF [Novosphingobium sp. SG919]NMN89087.1 conjugative transfer signal peptidase TraF [Novosphingobium sp. SG916]